MPIAFGGPGAITVAGTRAVPASAVLTATSTLSSTAVRTRLGVVPMTATSSLTSAAVRTQPAAVTMTATETLALQGARAAFGSVEMTSDVSTIDVALTVEQLVGVSMITTSTLTFGEQVWRSPMVGGSFEAAPFDSVGGYWNTPASRVTDGDTHSGTAAFAITGVDPVHSSGIIAMSLQSGMQPAYSTVRGSLWLKGTPGQQFMVGGRATTGGPAYSWLAEDGGYTMVTATGNWQYAVMRPWVGPSQTFLPGIEVRTPGNSSIAAVPAGTQLRVDDYELETSPPFAYVWQPVFGVSMTQTSSLTAASASSVNGSIIMAAATATLLAAGARLLPASVTMTATETLNVAAVRTQLTSVTMTSTTETLTAAGVRTQPASVTMTATETLTVTPLVTRQVTVAMTAAAAPAAAPAWRHIDGRSRVVTTGSGGRP